jgi:c-di-GMP-binding flagellar brake protein YcgR
MSKPMDLAALQAFEGAVDDHRDVVAAIACEEHTHFFSAKLLRRTDCGFSFETNAWPAAVPTSVATSRLKVAVHFGTSGAAVQLQADMLALQSSRQSDGNESMVIRCAKPSEIALVQRRAHFRAPVPVGAPLGVAVWKIPDHWVLRDKPKPSMQLRVELVDISPGGICVKVLPHRLGPDSIAPGDRLRAELQFAETSAVFDGRIVHRSEVCADGSTRVGIAFRQLDNTIEGRRASAFLDRVIGSLQRLGIKETADASAA